MAISQKFFSKSADFGAFFKTKVLCMSLTIFLLQSGEICQKKDHAKATD
jgi:hypothetical protein